VSAKQKMDESMANQIIMLGTSVTIDDFRKTSKEKISFSALADKDLFFAILVIIQFKVNVGSIKEHYPFWDNLFVYFTVFPLEVNCVRNALAIHSELKNKDKQPDFAGLLIAATAKTLHLPLATLNKKHFGQIAGLPLITKIEDYPDINFG
jgi:predicted nucleic acid-binding protein